MGRKRFAAIACLAAVSAACSHAAADPVALIRASAVGDTALLRGRLTLDGPCLYIVADNGDRWLAAFPSPGTTWNAEEQSVQVARQTLRVGSAGKFAGGETKGHLEWVRAPAAACDTTKVWRVTAIEPQRTRGDAGDRG